MRSLTKILYTCQVDANGATVLASKTAENQSHNVRHEGILVAEGGCPLSSEGLDIFWSVLHNVIAEKVKPAGYGVHPDEWQNSAYPTTEFINIGQRGAKQVAIQLTDPLWLERAWLWTQGLAVWLSV